MATKTKKPNAARRRRLAPTEIDAVASAALAAATQTATQTIADGHRLGRRAGAVPFPAGVRVYVAAPYGLASYVRGVHATLRRRGIAPTSTWAEDASDVDLATLAHASIGELRAVLDRNTLDVLRSDVVLALPREAQGGEMFAEIARALDALIPVVWTGDRMILSAYAQGVVRVRRLADAIDMIAAMPREGRHAIFGRGKGAK